MVATFSHTPLRFLVRLSPEGQIFEADAEHSLLDHAELAGFELPSSCRNGTCRSCMCRLLQGTVSYLIAWPGLSAEEKGEGYILPCVAVAQSPLLLDQRALPPGTQA